MTYAHDCGDYWRAMYVNRNKQWAVACDALGRPIKCASRKLAISVARYRRRRLKVFA